MALNLSEHPVGSVTLGQLSVYGETRLMAGRLHPALLCLCILSCSTLHNPGAGSCLPAVPLQSFWPRRSYCCLHMDEGGCPEMEVCLHLLELVNKIAIIRAHSWEIWGSSVLTLSERRVDDILSETPCICSLLKTFMYQSNVHSCAVTWRLAHAWRSGKVLGCN